MKRKRKEKTMIGEHGKYRKRKGRDVKRKKCGKGEKYVEFGRIKVTYVRR